MFRLTRRERILVIAILLAFVTGLVVKHYRTRDIPPPTAATEPQNAAK
jgi:hypothetical protein